MLSVDNNYDVKQNSKLSLEERKNNYIEFLFSNCKKNYNYDNFKGKLGNVTQNSSVGGSNDLDVDNYELIDYSNIESVNFKNDLIKNLSNAISDVLNVSKISNSASSDEHIKHLEKIIPNPRKGTSIVSDKQKHAQICNTIADIINRYYGNIINKSVSPDNTCNQIFDMVESLSVGLYREFTTVSKSVHISLKNMEDTLTVLENHYNKMVTKLQNKNDYTVEESFKMLHNEIIKELKRQIGILRNLTTTNIKHTEKSLYEIIKNNKHVKSLIKETFPTIGTDEFSDKLSFAFEGLGSASEIANIVKKSLKNIGMTLNEFKTYNDKSNFLLKTQQLADEISTENLNETYLKSFYEAINQLTKYFPKRKDIEGGKFSVENKYNDHKHINDTSSKIKEIEIPSEYKFGGKKMSKRLEEQSKNENSTRLLLINDFVSKYNILINNMYTLYTNIGLLINKGEIPITDESHSFKQYMTTTDFTLNKELIEEYFVSLEDKHKQKKIEFLNKFYFLIQLLQQLQKYNKIFEEFINLINGIIKLIESYQEKYKVFSSYKDTDENFTNYNVKYGGSDYIIYNNKDDIENIKSKFNYNYNNAILKKNLNSEFKKLDNFNKGYEEYTSFYIKNLYEKNSENIENSIKSLQKYNFVQQDNFLVTYNTGRARYIKNSTPYKKSVPAPTTWVDTAVFAPLSTIFLKLEGIAKFDDPTEDRKSLDDIHKNKRESYFEFFRTIQAVELYLNDMTQQTKLENNLIESLYKSIIATKYIPEWYSEKYYKELISLFLLPTSSNLILSAEGIETLDASVIYTSKKIDSGGRYINFINSAVPPQIQINYTVGSYSNTYGLSVKEHLIHSNSDNNVLNWLSGKINTADKTDERFNQSMDYIIWETCAKDPNNGDISTSLIPGSHLPLVSSYTNMHHNKSEFRLLPNMVKNFTTYYHSILKKNHGLKNIISLFNSVIIKNSKNKYMSSNTIYENIINFMVHTSYTNEETKYHYFKLTNEIDKNLDLMLKAITGKIISSIKRNIQILNYDTNITIEKTIIGGNNEKIIIIPEIVELYKRLPLYADFYKSIFFNNYTVTKKRFEIIIPKNSIWTEFITHTIKSNRSSSETIYSDKYCSLLIYYINKIYIYYKSSNNVILTIINSFINEINNSFGIVDFDETGVESEKKKYNSEENLFNILDEESNSILPIDRELYLINNQSKHNEKDKNSSTDIKGEIELFKQLYIKIKNSIDINQTQMLGNNLASDIISAKKRIKENPENDVPIVISLIKGNSYKLNYVEYMLYLDFVFVPTKLISHYIGKITKLYDAVVNTDKNISLIIQREIKFLISEGSNIFSKYSKNEDVIYEILNLITEKIKKIVVLPINSLVSFKNQLENKISDTVATSCGVAYATFANTVSTNATTDNILNNMKTYKYNEGKIQNALFSDKGCTTRVGAITDIYEHPLMYDKIINNSVKGISFLDIIMQIINLKDISMNIIDNKININDSMILSNITKLINNVLDIENNINKNNKNLKLDNKVLIEEMLILFNNFKKSSNDFNNCKYLNVIIKSYMLFLITQDELNTRVFVNNDYHDTVEQKKFIISDKFQEFFGKITDLKSVTAKKSENASFNVGFIKSFNNIIYNTLENCYDSVDNKIYLSLIEGMNNNTVSDEIRKRDGWCDIFTTFTFSDIIGMCLYNSSFDEIEKILKLDKALLFKKPTTSKHNERVKYFNYMKKNSAQTINKLETHKTNIKHLFGLFNQVEGGEMSKQDQKVYPDKSDLTVKGGTIEVGDIIEVLYNNIFAKIKNEDLCVYITFSLLLSINRDSMNNEYNSDHFDLLKKTIAIHLFKFLKKNYNIATISISPERKYLYNMLISTEYKNLENQIEKSRENIRRKLNTAVSTQNYSMDEKKNNQYKNRMNVIKKYYLYNRMFDIKELNDKKSIINKEKVIQEMLENIYQTINEKVEIEIDSLVKPITNLVDILIKEKSVENTPSSNLDEKVNSRDLENITNKSDKFYYSNYKVFKDKKTHVYGLYKKPAETDIKEIKKNKYLPEYVLEILPKVNVKFIDLDIVKYFENEEILLNDFATQEQTVITNYKKMYNKTSQEKLKKIEIYGKENEFKELKDPAEEASIKKSIADLYKEEKSLEGEVLTELETIKKCFVVMDNIYILLQLVEYLNDNKSEKKEFTDDLILEKTRKDKGIEYSNAFDLISVAIETNKIVDVEDPSDITKTMKKFDLTPNVEIEFDSIKASLKRIIELHTKKPTYEFKENTAKIKKLDSEITVLNNEIRDLDTEIKRLEADAITVNKLKVADKSELKTTIEGYYTLKNNLELKNLSLRKKTEMKTNLTDTITKHDNDETEINNEMKKITDLRDGTWAAVRYTEYKNLLIALLTTGLKEYTEAILLSETAKINGKKKLPSYLNPDDIYKVEEKTVYEYMYPIYMKEIEQIRIQIDEKSRLYNNKQETKKKYTEEKESLDNRITTLTKTISDLSKSVNTEESSIATFNNTHPLLASQVASQVRSIEEMKTKLNYKIREIERNYISISLQTGPTGPHKTAHEQEKLDYIQNSKQQKSEIDNEIKFLTNNASEYNTYLKTINNYYNVSLPNFQKAQTQKTDTENHLSTLDDKLNKLNAEITSLEAEYNNLNLNYTNRMYLIDNVIKNKLKISGGYFPAHSFFNSVLTLEIKDDSIMSYSNSVILYNIINEETLKNTKKYLYNTISEIPSRNKSVLKSVLYKSKYRFNKLTNSVSFYYWLIDNHYTFATCKTDFEDTTDIELYKNLLSKILNGCKSMIDTCNNIINELNDNIIYYENNENSFQLYKNSTGLIPVSSLLFLLMTKKSSTNNENRYNFSNRIIYSNTKLNIDIFPWTKALINRYNNFNNKISINTIVETIEIMLDIIREFILEDDVYYNIKKTATTADADNNFINSYITQSEKPSQSELINNFIFLIKGEEDRKNNVNLGLTNLDLIYNINDIGISPINLDALKSDIPLISMYINSLYYDNIEEKQKKSENHIAKRLKTDIKASWIRNTTKSCVGMRLDNIFHNSIYDDDKSKEGIFNYIYDNLKESNNIIKLNIYIEEMLNAIIYNFKLLRNNVSKTDSNLGQIGSIESLENTLI